MAGSSARDRFFTPQVARAITAPSGVLLAAGVIAAALLVGLPIVAAVALGVLAWAIKVALAIPRSPRPERVDPFTLHEPWRRYVQESLQARNRFTETVRGARPGPLRDRLEEIAERMETAVNEVWLIAKRGEALVEARRGINVTAVERRLAELGAPGPDAISDGASDISAGGADLGHATGGLEPEGQAGTGDPAVARTIDALRSQRATAERLDRVIAEAQTELRLLDARLDEAAARTLELSAHTGGDAVVGGLGSDVDQLVSEMESLRQALEETSGSPPGGLASGGASA